MLVAVSVVFAFGVKVTCTEQAAPDARLLPQLLVDAKFAALAPAIVIERSPIVVVPVLVRLIVCGELLLPGPCSKINKNWSADSVVCAKVCDAEISPRNKITGMKTLDRNIAPPQTRNVLD